MRLWRRFQIWRARLKYGRVRYHEIMAWKEKTEADELMRKHAQPPCPLFDRLTNDGEK
jgi:hypothetical protein